jgi:hypothetical protein
VKREQKKKNGRERKQAGHLKSFRGLSMGALTNALEEEEAEDAGGGGKREQAGGKRKAGTKKNHK